MQKVFTEKYLKHIIIAGIALFILIASLSIPAIVSSTIQERNIPFGYPIPFLFINSSYDLYEEYQQPYSFNFGVAFLEKEHPMNFSGRNFLISFVIVFAFVEALTMFLIYLYPYFNKDISE